MEVRRAVLLLQTEDNMIDKICVSAEDCLAQSLGALLQFEEERHLSVSAHLVFKQLDGKLPLPALDRLLRDVAVRDIRRETKS